ncbi:MAG TPA: hypothetical protein VK979_04065 [Guyparkeria sp.]|nr:hypothetical protein [Guyparkeria sp.]
MKFMHLVTLLLALWAPFNAVTAGVSMLDCPMSDLALGQTEPCPAHAGPADSTADNGMAGCDHCANCVLMHGGASAPTTFTSAIVPLPQVVPATRVADRATSGILDTPFRPPLSA